MYRISTVQIGWSASSLEPVGRLDTQTLGVHTVPFATGSETAVKWQ